MSRSRRVASGSPDHVPPVEDHHVEDVEEDLRSRRAVLERVKRGPPFRVQRDHFAVDQCFVRQRSEGLPDRSDTSG